MEMPGSCRWEVDVPKQDHQSPLWSLTPVSAPVLPGNIQRSGSVAAAVSVQQDNHRYSQFQLEIRECH